MNFRRIQFLNGYRDIASDFSCFHETYIILYKKGTCFLKHRWDLRRFQNTLRFLQRMKRNICCDDRFLQL